MKRCLLPALLLGTALASHAQPATPHARLMKLVSPPGAVFVQDSL